MKTYIHIGQHKTGSSSFQAALLRDREYLLRQGLYVPVQPLFGQGANHYALNVITLAPNRYSTKKIEYIDSFGEDSIEQLRHDLQVAIQLDYKRASELGCTAIIWSNEGLYLLNSHNEYRNLQSLFAPYSSEQIAVWVRREASSYIHSYSREIQPKINSVTANRLLETLSGGWLVDYDRKEFILKTCFSDALIIDYKQKVDSTQAIYRAVQVKPKLVPALWLNVTDA